MRFQSSLILPFLATLPTLSLGAALTSGQLKSSMALAAIFNRQIHNCVRVEAPVTCERSCGAGYIQCVVEGYCYNPGFGQTCCSNGTYCDAGKHCTDAGCCRNGSSLEECGATRTLSTIPPSVPETTTPAAPSSTTPAAVTTTSTTVDTTTVSTTTVDTTTVSMTTVDTATVVDAPTGVFGTETTATAAATTKTTTATTIQKPTSSTATASPTIVVQTANSAPRQGQAVLGLAFGGMGLAAFL